MPKYVTQTHRKEFYYYIYIIIEPKIKGRCLYFGVHNYVYLQPTSYENAGHKSEQKEQKEQADLRERKVKLVYAFPNVRLEE